MILFIASEIMFFGGLFATYFSLRADQTSWPPAGTQAPGILLPIAFTGCLVASSITLHRAGGAAPERVRAWLAATIGLGTIFILGQAWEWRTLMAEGLNVSTDAYGTTFFTLTGAHGIHVIGGLGMLLATYTRLREGAHRPGMLEAVAYYWHFVDVVWLVLFTAVYLTV
jgi:cytochrome c oxidase subunit 3